VPVYATSVHAGPSLVVVEVALALVVVVVVFARVVVCSLEVVVVFDWQLDIHVLTCGVHQ
jgi:hypothetical protein